MSKTVPPTRKQTKRERQRSAAEARSAARRRQSRRRTLAYLLGGAALVAVIALAVFALAGDGGSSGGGSPSQAGKVSTSGPARTEPLAAGEAVPEYSAPAIGGGTTSWSDAAGSPTVLSVWAPWCPHCQVELPLLNRVMRDYPGVRWVTIVTAIGESPGPDPTAFLQDNGISAPTAIDDARGTLASAFGIRGFPTLYFVGSDGVVVQEMEGEVDEATLRSTIESLS
jgi:thiol-disulfide isomerase/thioredoxin